MDSNDITITIPGEWNVEDDGYEVMALAIAAWHKALQPPHVLEVGDEVLVYNDGGTARNNDKVTAIGRFAALVMRGASVEARIPREHLTTGRALVCTKDGREVKPVWPSS